MADKNGPSYNGSMHVSGTCGPGSIPGGPKVFAVNCYLSRRWYPYGEGAIRMFVGPRSSAES